ncbi:MAG: DNA repair protein RecN [Lentisphaerae bacterium]|jgi:DNA repair protein RecN (Recombination protein N)|nr:DNA repair protein RecN [Lentisphaerota bacterium]
MLESLYIRNLALVAELHLDFSSGLNTVSGETGAGKSLIIGAIQLLAGGRASPASIRKGASSCEVSGIFRLDRISPDVQEELLALLVQAGLPPCEEQRLLLRRVINENGSRAFVNSTPVTASFLKELGERLIDIHGPHDNHSLLSPNRQLALLDSFANLDAELQDCRKIWHQLEQTRQAFRKLKEETLAPEEIQLLSYQLREIEQAHLQEGEEEEVLARHRLISHARRLIELAQQCSQGFNESENCLCDQIASFLRLLREIEQIDSVRGQDFVERLGSISEQLNELGQDLSQYGESLDLDEEELQRIEERLNLLQKLKRKYGPTLADVIACSERLKLRLQRIEGRTQELEQLQNREKELLEQHQKCCDSIRQKRQKAATRLAKEISGKLLHLGFSRAAFQVGLQNAPPSVNGADSVEFSFAPNIGEEMLPLRQIASSGEIARVMLAIKTVLCDADKVPVLVFDEIDANIGGRVASAVASELQAVGKNHQVFCITHLPRIAAAGQTHFLVTKHVENQRTLAEMHPLDEKSRIEELTRMLGADENSQSARQHAGEMLKEALSL